MLSVSLLSEIHYWKECLGQERYKGGSHHRNADFTAQWDKVAPEAAGKVNKLLLLASFSGRSQRGSETIILMRHTQTVLMALSFHDIFVQHGKRWSPPTSAAAKPGKVWSPNWIMQENGNLAYAPGRNHLPGSTASIPDPSHWHS